MWILFETMRNSSSLQREVKGHNVQSCFRLQLMEEHKLIESVVLSFTSIQYTERANVY